MSLAHLVYQHWFITCLLLWALTMTISGVVRAFAEAELRRLRVVLGEVAPAKKTEPYRDLGPAMESRE